ncbi:MAG: GNAT family N-acetyltransferase [Candidatus Dadabacteria bacterium]|nr:GNAT family N-acetyltransferase [Candidatus Dadabacteria bacterium]NIS08545.1 GNAT family N-acetyltransferase [Candidatus Dadabacteria bacterium]NIV41373.1 hypothetical protein [Candidatus Dadabacteria bacterium]NIX14580.1 hypothetical protein [Candidatus Dadabacteria bacterium]NIY21035.1 hypothetical protein [Candidatus Dadabacteria bacterium]
MDEIDLLSEKIEREALVSLHQCCPSGARKEIVLDLVEVADCTIACAVNDPSILLNRALGLGTKQEITAESIERVAEVYRSKSIKNYFMHIYEDSLTDDARELLNGPKFVKKRGWMKFRSYKPEPIESKTALRVEKVGPDKSADFGMVVCRAFGMLDISVPLMAGLANDERWKLYVTYDGDKPAGAGALFICENMGWFEWGATLPEFRRRGSQASIMAARINLAREYGCKYIFTETGEAVEGGPQHSYKNIMRAGYEESIMRQNYAPSNI